MYASVIAIILLRNFNFYFQKQKFTYLDRRILACFLDMKVNLESNVLYHCLASMIHQTYLMLSLII